MPWLHIFTSAIESWCATLSYIACAKTIIFYCDTEVIILNQRTMNSLSISWSKGSCWKILFVLNDAVMCIRKNYENNIIYQNKSMRKPNFNVQLHSEYQNWYELIYKRYTI